MKTAMIASANVVAVLLRVTIAGMNEVAKPEFVSSLTKVVDEVTDSLGDAIAVIAPVIAEGNGVDKKLKVALRPLKEAIRKYKTAVKALRPSKQGIEGWDGPNEKGEYRQQQYTISVEEAEKCATLEELKSKMKEVTHVRHND